ncbi:hypothetical protein ACCUM_4243 [Candidatus Accumulibacter phosphatis]|uniref:Uncharacterized protein n=1 Tax=Candidatus Accumulibacter phosphatis TaxID=327160 RepID=A0A5S4EH29_9PROT|nr:hypothetical protein ACCUM_4243 [Candidatus Accumulibacter phosphatis]
MWFGISTRAAAFGDDAFALLWLVGFAGVIGSSGKSGEVSVMLVTWQHP